MKSFFHLIVDNTRQNKPMISPMMIFRLCFIIELFTYDIRSLPDHALRLFSSYPTTDLQARSESVHLIKINVEHCDWMKILAASLRVDSCVKWTIQVPDVFVENKTWISCSCLLYLTRYNQML